MLSFVESFFIVIAVLGADVSIIVIIMCLKELYRWWRC